MPDNPPYSEPIAPQSSAPNDRLALLYHLSQAFNSSLDLDEVLNRVMDEVILTMHAERGFVMLKDENGELIFHVARGMDQRTVSEPGFEVSLSIVESVAQEGQAVMTSDAQMDPRWNMRQSVRLLGLRSILCVPLRVKERLLGILYVDNRMQASIFSQADLELMNAIASSAAIAIENARLYQVAVEKGRLEQELDLARKVQADLLPQTVPEIRGYEFASRWLPARQVAGDFYDFIPTKDGKLGITVGDVSDKGMPAALFMALTRSILRASLDPDQPLNEAVERANCLISEDSTSGMFVTLFFAWLIPESGEIVYVNAGHNPTLYFQRGKRAGQGFMGKLTRTGMALGVLDDNRYEEKRVRLSPGDFMVFYTDGVTDALNSQGVDFGLGRLESVILDHREKNAEEIASALENSLLAFTGGEALFDDVTFVIARRIG